MGEGEVQNDFQASGLASRRMLEIGRQQVCERNDEIKSRRSQGMKPSRQRKTRQDEKGAGMTW